MLQKLVNSKLIVFLFFLSVTGQSERLYAQNERPPNILFLVADDAGWKDFGCYGHPTLKTPNIDKLAAGGLKFTNAFLTTSSCSPSRTSILAGQYAHTIGTEDMHVPLPDSVKMLPWYLRQKGYFTGNMLKTHYGASGEKQFQWYNNKLDSFAQFLDQAKDAPFFMWIGFHDPHRPYNQKGYKTRFDPAKVIVPPTLANTPETRQDIANYYSELIRLDDQIGELLAELNKRGLRENTLVVFISDNGAPFPREKGTLYDKGIGTPLILNWPAKIKAGRTHEGLVSSVDLAPTVLDLAESQIPKNMAGLSLRPIISQKGNYNRMYAFSERNWHGIDEHIRSIRTLDYKFITNEYKTLPHGSPSDITDSDSWRNLFKLKKIGGLNNSQSDLFRYPRPAIELYDVRKDPDEMNNLAYKPEFAGMVRKFEKVLQQWQADTRDVHVNDHLKKDKEDRFSGEVVK